MVPMDVDMEVAEIVSATVEVATVVNASSMEDVVVIIMLLTLLILLLVLLPLLKDMVLLGVEVLSLQVVVMDKVVVLFTLLVVA